MKTSEGWSGGVAQHILNPGFYRKQVISFRFTPLYLGGRNPL